MKVVYGIEGKKYIRFKDKKEFTLKRIETYYPEENSRPEAMYVIEDNEGNSNALPVDLFVQQFETVDYGM